MASVGYKHIASGDAATGVLAGQASPLQYAMGELAHVVINTPGATGNVLTIYDDINGSTAANIIAIIDTTLVGVAQRTYQLQFRRGLFYSFNGAGTQADVTVVW